MDTFDKKAMTKWYDEYAKDEELSDDQVVSVLGARYRLVAREIERLVSLMSFCDDDLVLDAGCGAGRFLYRIRKTGNCQTVGIDTSRNMVERARKRVPDTNYLIADVLHLPFRTRAFTAVICYSVLWHTQSERNNHFINTDIYEKGLREFSRVLELGGRVLFNISNPFHLQSIIDFVLNLIDSRLARNGKLQTYCISLGMAKNILARLGFRICDVIARGYYPILLETLYSPFHHMPSDNMINRYYNSFSRLENSLVAKRLLHMFAHTFVIRAISDEFRETIDDNSATREGKSKIRALHIGTLIAQRATPVKNN